MIAGRVLSVTRTVARVVRVLLAPQDRTFGWISSSGSACRLPIWAETNRRSLIEVEYMAVVTEACRVEQRDPDMLLVAEAVVFELLQSPS